MRAAWMQGFGGPDVLGLGEAPDLVAGPGQVVVDVAFANLTVSTFHPTYFSDGTVGDVTLGETVRERRSGSRRESG